MNEYERIKKKNYRKINRVAHRFFAINIRLKPTFKVQKMLFKQSPYACKPHFKN